MTTQHKPKLFPPLMQALLEGLCLGVFLFAMFWWVVPALSKLFPGGAGQ